MMCAGMTRKEATEEWVLGFNKFPTDMIRRMMVEWPDEWVEVTYPQEGDRVYLYDTSDRQNDLGEVIRCEKGDGTFIIELNDGETVSLEREWFEPDYEDVVPMWDTMWSFGNPIDDWWLEHKDGVRKLARL